MPAEKIIDRRERDQFSAELVARDNDEVTRGDMELKVGTFVTVQKEGFHPDSVYVITRIFSDGTFEIGGEKSVFTNERFFPEELTKLGSDFDIFEVRKKFGRA